MPYASPRAIIFIVIVLYYEEDTIPLRIVLGAVFFLRFAFKIKYIILLTFK